MNAAIKGILFDLDGTLLDHRGAADAAITSW
ncbi:MAG: HAD family hydrolase, partial [Nonomuraea sp.]|nr:HAD family hydrolase [Nonomuraea sp.]NUP65479.1 HAD family hydrolase [Nonomuraea sp.]